VEDGGDVGGGGGADREHREGVVSKE
jgi:hypothetical protein